MASIKNLPGERKLMEQNKKLIRVVIFSYKNKNLESVVKSVIDNSSSHLCIDVIDKNTIDRRSIFEKYKDVNYQYFLWTKVDSPTKYKDQFLHNKEFDYILIISDDVILKSGWDTDLINSCPEDSIISGQHKTYIYNKNKFYLGKINEYTKEVTLNNFIDRNLIFGSNKTLSRIEYPIQVKYYGEEELLSIDAFCKGIDIYSMPSGFYEDLGLRTIENIYTPFSIQHGYNNFVSLIKDSDFGKDRTIADFIGYHRIEVNNINKLPFERNDVLYDSENALRVDKGEKFFDRRATV